MNTPLREENPGIVYAIPQQPSAVISATEYQQALCEAKNKGQMLRVCLRTLTSRGMHSNADKKLWEKIQEYVEDFPETPE